MHDLTSPAMAILCIQRPLPVHFVGDPPALTLSVPLHWAELVGGLDPVRRPVLPLFGLSGVLRDSICVRGLWERRGRGRDFFRHGGWLVAGGMGGVIYGMMSVCIRYSYLLKPTVDLTFISMQQDIRVKTGFDTTLVGASAGHFLPNQGKVQLLSRNVTQHLCMT